MNSPKKSLGQHWLDDQDSLTAMCSAGLVHEHDVVLEVGPGPGALTKLLVEKARQVIAVEYDSDLARELSSRVSALNLSVIEQDILKFDFTKLPVDYKLVANIPYYLTSNLVRVLCESSNPPKVIALLIQKEVAERMSAGPGDLSILGVTTQMYYQSTLMEVVPKELFFPAPKVDSQIIQLLRRSEPLFGDRDSTGLFRVVRAGFGNKRKTLVNSLSAGLHKEKTVVQGVLSKLGWDQNIRAQELTLDNWLDLYEELSSIEP